ncbi:MAG: M23 family peptidase [Alphaproteobacteria bacterium]|nr:M23 family peptidase [Alphaproteobacteria bacterium]
MGAPFGLHRWLTIAAVMAGVALPAHGASDEAGPAPSLAFPVDCKLSDTCFIQFHVDLAPGPEIRDYKCARLTYDGHKGTDIRLPDYPSMRAGVAVLAAADGGVRAIREGEPDISLDVRGMDDLGGKDAGNAVVIVHSEGWETQYSHMMRGSVVVKAGDQVKQGQVLGKIGLSGRSNFPHLDFSARRKGEIIDPFLDGEPNMNCERPGSSLWTEAARAIMPYQPGGVLLAGFASVEPDKTAVRDGAPDKAEQIALSIPQPRIRLEAMIGIVEARRASGDIADALEIEERAVALVHSLENPIERAFALIDLAMLAARAGSIENANSALKEETAIARTLDDPFGRTRSLSRIATALAGLRGG